MHTPRFLRQTRALAAVLTLAAAAAACGGGEPPAARAATRQTRGIHPGTVHPTAENLPPRSQLAALIAARPLAGGHDEVARFARRLARARQVRTLGVMDGPPEQVFGVVEDVASDRAGRIYILDSRYNNVRIFHADGTPLGAFGGPGRGPAEFGAPEAMELDRSGRVLVADRFNQMKLFVPDGEGFRNEATFPVRFVPEDFCLLDGTVYLQGIASTGNVIHAFSTSGERLRSFGRPYQTENWLVRNQLSDGPIACSEEAGTLVTMFKYLPLVFGYSPRGELRWVTRLADFRPVRIVEGVAPGGRPEVSFEAGNGPADAGESLQAAPGGLVVVQTARHTPASLKERREFAELRTYVLSARTGEGVYVGNHLPRISSVGPNRVLAASNDPFPLVRILSLPAKEGSR